MKIIIGFLLFNVYANTESIKSKAVNLALETVLEFDKKDRSSDIKFINDIQHFLNKVKNVLNKNDDSIEAGPYRRHIMVMPLSFTEFLENILAILKSYDDYELKKIIKLLQDEIRRYNYKGCKFYELLEQQHVRDMLNKKLYELTNSPLVDVRRRMDEIITELQDRKLGKDNQEIIDYVNSLYKPEEPRKLLDVLNNLQVYQTNTKRSFSDLTRIVRHGLRNVVFNHYSQLKPDMRRGLKIRLEYLAKNAQKEVIDHRIYAIRDNPKTTQASAPILLSVPTEEATTVPTEKATIVPTTKYSIIYDFVRLKPTTTTAAIVSSENSVEFIHVYPKDIVVKHEREKKTSKNLLRTIWEEKWTTPKRKLKSTKKEIPNKVNKKEVTSDTEEIKYLNTKSEEDSKVLDIDASTTTDTTTNKITKKKHTKKQYEFTTDNTDGSNFVTKKHLKKRHRKKHNKNTTSISTKSTPTTKHHKRKKVHKKYVKDTTTTFRPETTRADHHKKHHKKTNLEATLPVSEEFHLNKIDYNKTMEKKKLRWKKTHDSRFKSTFKTTSLAPNHNKITLETIDVSKDIKKTTDYAVSKPHKKRLKHIVLGMPMSNDHYYSSEMKSTKKKKSWAYTKDKILPKKIENEENNQRKKKKHEKVTLKTPTARQMHTIEYELIEKESNHRPVARPGKFRVFSDDDSKSVERGQIGTNSSFEETGDGAPASLRIALSDEGLTIESFEDRAKKLYIGRRTENATDTDSNNKQTIDSNVMKRIDDLEKELQDVKHIILDKESKKFNNESGLSETDEESDITSYEFENSTETNSTGATVASSLKTSKQPSSNPISNVTKIRKGFDEYSVSIPSTNLVSTPSVGKDNNSKIIPMLRYNSNMNTTNSSTEIIEADSYSTSSTKQNTDTPVFRTRINVTTNKSSVEELSIGTTPSTPSIDSLIENFIAREKAKNELLIHKNITTAAVTITTITTKEIKKMPSKTTDTTINNTNSTTVEFTTTTAEVTTKIDANTTGNRLNTSNIMRLSENHDSHRKNMDYYYEDNLVNHVKNNRYDVVFLNDMKDDKWQT